jgi:nanoRNase/pAp phosphatase (c-di-AMP/oligoRNAs hydrolase)
VQANVLHFIPNERWMDRAFSGIAAAWEQDFKTIGELLFEKNERSVKRAIGSAYRFTTPKGTRVVMFDGLKTSSDASEALGTEADLVVGFMPLADDGVPKYVFSTRSRADYDCSALAKAHGGGGHTKAAGFNVTIDPKTALNPYAVFKAIVEAHENPVA